VYEPEVLRWIFASYRPNTEFQISFDLDVIKIYEDYDRAVRQAHETDDGSRKDKKRQVARRTLELAGVRPCRIAPGSAPPNLVQFRHLGTVLQTFDGDVAAALAHFQRSGGVQSEGDRLRFEQRARCVWNWIETYAPEDFRYRIRTQGVVRSIDAPTRVALQQLVVLLESDPPLDEKALGQAMKGRAEASGLDLKGFYPVVYDLLLGRDRGPKLTSLLVTMGPRRALPLLRPSLGEDL
jgi:lysyl-tRNA synthetase class 1